MQNTHTAMGVSALVSAVNGRYRIARDMATEDDTVTMIQCECTVIEVCIDRSHLAYDTTGAMTADLIEDHLRHAGSPCDVSAYVMTDIIRFAR